MKRKKKKASKVKLTPISNILIERLKSHPFSIKFVMFLEMEKKCEEVDFMDHVYEMEIKLDWSEIVYCKYIDETSSVRFIFYSTINEYKDPIFAFEIELSLKEYLNLVERILGACNSKIP